MKTTIILFLCFIAFAFTLVNKPSGKWKLEKVEADGKTIFPKSDRFDLYFYETSVGYYDGCNDCGRQIVLFDDSNILLANGACTAIKCLRIDSVAKYIDYSGKYKLQDSLLIITNTKGKLYLIKEKE